MSWTAIETADELTALLGERLPRVRDKARASLHPRDRDRLAASPFCVMGTASAAGTCDVSPKGDPAGRLVHVIDDVTIALAERPGNRRADGDRGGLPPLREGVPALGAVGPLDVGRRGRGARRAVLAREIDVPTMSLEELDAYYGPSYAERLYG